MSSLSMSERVPGSATADLHVCLLGPPSLAWRGEPLTLPRRQARALLYYLAAIPQSVARDRLCLLFWPDETETTARCNLSRLVSILHNALPDPALLITSNDQVGLARQASGRILQTFEQLWAAWKAGGQPSCLQQAIALYRGPFLDGFSLPDSPEYEAWMTTERQRWERMALQALAALVEDQAAKGEYASAITYAQRYLAIDDLSEEMHRRLIELYALVGDRAAAAAPVRASRGRPGTRARAWIPCRRPRRSIAPCRRDGRRRRSIRLRPPSRHTCFLQTYPLSAGRTPGARWRRRTPGRAAVGASSCS